MSVQGDDGDVGSEVGGPGGRRLLGGGGGGGPPAPMQVQPPRDRPQRKGSKSGGSTDSAPASVQRAQVGPPRGIQQGDTGGSSLRAAMQAQKARGPLGPATPVNDIIPPRAPGHPGGGTTGLQRYQTTLASTMDVAALASLQVGPGGDALLQSLDPFIGKRGVQSLGPGIVASSPVTQQQAVYSLTHDDVAQMHPEDLNTLAGPAATAGLVLEKVDVSPPRTPPASPPQATQLLAPGGGRRAAQDPAAVVAEIENRELAKAAREMLEETLEGYDIRRSALGAYYASAQDIGFNHPNNTYVGDSRFDPLRVAQMQRAANVDPFIRTRGLGIPDTVDWTRVPPPGAGMASLSGPELDGVHVMRDLQDEPPDPQPLDVGTAGPIQQIAPKRIPGATKALLIGVGYTDTPYTMADSGFNVLKMKAHLTQRGFFGQFLCLSDEPGATTETLPTYANMVTALRWLVEDAVPGDALFLYFCGRAQQREGSPDSTDLLPCDFESSGALADYYVSELVLPQIPIGAKLTVLSDCYPSGQVIDLPYKMVANPDGSFRLIEEQPTRCPGLAVQMAGKRDFAGGGEPLLDLTQRFVDLSAVGSAPTYKEVLTFLRDGLAPVGAAPVVSLNRPADFKKVCFHLGAPATAAEDDPRLCEAKQKTKDLAADLGVAEEEVVAAQERLREEMAQKQRADAERRAELRRLQDVINRERALKQLEKLMEAVQTDEAVKRVMLRDEEAAARHRLALARHESEAKRLQFAINRQGWNRLPAPENSGLPIVVGVKWQRPEERQKHREDAFRTFGEEAASKEPGTHSRVFDVIRRPAFPPSPVVAVRGDYPVQETLQPQQQHPARVVRWKRIPDDTGGAQWIRENVTASPADSPHRQIPVFP